MTGIKEPTKLEQINGNLLTQSALTALATIAGTPLAALLPVLSGSLASSRHSKRVEEAINDINKKLIKFERKVKEFSDAQYKLVNETILTILQTTQQEKIEYLKSAITNAIEKDIGDINIATQLSRVLRDITADEIAFLIKNRNYYMIVTTDNIDSKGYNDPHQLKISTLSSDNQVLAGLISMGLILPEYDRYEEYQGYCYKYSFLVPQLLNVVCT